MAAAAQEQKPTTVSGDFEVDTNGTIFVLDADVKKSLSAKLAKENEGSSLSDYAHTVTVEDYSAGKATVHVTAQAVAKK